MSAGYFERLERSLVEAARREQDAARGLGPSADQLDAIERLRAGCDVVVAEWLAGSGEVEAICLNDGRPKARCRIYADGRCVEERTWQ